jgi:GxxExxY protein
MAVDIERDDRRLKSAEYIYKDLTYRIIGAIYAVHKELWSVHKEVIYHRALALELSDNNISFSDEKAIDVTYKGEKIGVYKPDFIIDDKVILEIKVMPMLAKAAQNQAYYYAKGTKYKLVLLANFGTTKVGIKRLIYN